MPKQMPEDELDPVRRCVGRYSAALRREVADRLLRSRGKHSSEELTEKIAAATANVPLIDRRLRDLEPSARGLLALVHLSRRCNLRLGGLLELLSGLGSANGMEEVFQLFEAGLLFPEVPALGPVLGNFEEWLGRAGSTEYRVFAPPRVADRAAALPLPLDPLADVRTASAEVREADGLEWLLRLGVLWQMTKNNPLRLTQNGEFFKKDHERLTSDPLLNAPPSSGLVELRQMGHFAVALGMACGILVHESGEIRAAENPSALECEPAEVLGKLWSELAELDAWNPAQGWRGLSAPSSPFGSAGLLALALLSQLKPTQWTTPAALADWLAARHCYWNSAQPVVEAEEEGDDDEEECLAPPLLQEWIEPFLLGVAFELRLIQAAHEAEGETLIRLSPLGRHVLGCGPAIEPPRFPQTLLVQPNLELLAYRQGLTPELIARLTCFCTWKTLGPACTLQLQPESVYRGLETGLSHEAIMKTLQQHAVRELPPGVVQALKTWADKRERVSVYGSATLLEFSTPEDLQDALSRGLPATPLTDRLALVAQESDIDFRHFRLTGTRDYALPPDQCVEVAADGVTLSIDTTRADLLLDTELQRFAEASPAPDASGKRIYRLTPASLRRGQEGGIGVRTLETWFHQRAGTTLPPAVRMFLGNNELPPSRLDRLIVLQTATELLADGLMQWPPSRRLIHARLGPTALVVAEPLLAELTRLLKDLEAPVTLNVQANSCIEARS